MSANGSLTNCQNLSRVQIKCLNIALNYPLYGSYTYNWIAVATLDMTTAFLALTLNFLTLFVIFKYRSLHNITNYILCSLAVSDMLTGMLSQPIKGIQTIMITMCKPSCILHVVGVQIGYFLAIASCLTLFLISLERYMAIFHVYRYHKSASNKVIIVKLIFLIWIISAMVVSLSFFTPGMAFERYFLALAGPLSFMWGAFVQFRCLRLIRKIHSEDSQRLKKVRNVAGLQKEKVSCDSVDSNNHTAVNNYKVNYQADGNYCRPTSHDEVLDEVSHTSYHREQHVEVKQKYRVPANKYVNKRPNSKATKMAAMILLSMLICYTPSTILITWRQISYLPGAMLALFDWCQSLVLLNSVFNPLIYCWYTRKMRKKLKSLWQCK